MEHPDQLITLYSGTQVAALLLQGQLQEAGIESAIQNDVHSGMVAGFGFGTDTTVRVNIKSSDLEKAQMVLKDFENSNS